MINGSANGRLKVPEADSNTVAYDHSDVPSCLETEASQRPVATRIRPRALSDKDIKLIVIRSLAST